MADESAQDKKTPANDLLQQLATAETLTQHNNSGLDEFEGLHIESATDYIALKTSAHKTLKEELKLATALPGPPSLGELQFLIKHGASDIKELFEDTWNSATLAYAAAAQVCVDLSRLLEAGDIPEDDDIFTNVRRLLLTTSNVPARSLLTYKYIARKQANKQAVKPGSERDRVLTTQEAKDLNTTLETAAKLKKKTNPFTRAPQRRCQSRWSRFPGTNYTRGRRGRGRGRRGGRRGSR